MYVCGPTVYDEPHLGHARCYITWDVLYRFLKFLGEQQGFRVEYARNITDVDDKIIKKALAQNVSIQEITTEYTQAFNEAMQSLNVETPTHQPYATKHITDMAKIIEKLVQAEYAYVTASGSIYYRTAKKADYGKLCGQSLDNLESGARVEVDTEKENPLDFALWKATADDDVNSFDSPQVKGASKKGRPGWHIECSAMIDAVFEGQPLDIHAGGYDLVFPHHENEIAQSEAYSGKEPFAKYWLHNGFVNVSGEKMSKSLGNFATIKSLLKVYKDPDIIRHFILNNKYRQPVDFSEQALEHSKNWVNKKKNELKLYVDSPEPIQKETESLGLATKGYNLIQKGKVIVKCYLEGKREILGLDVLSSQLFNDYVPKFIEGMKNDLNTSIALAELNNIFKLWLKGRTASSQEADFSLSVFLYLSSLLGFRLDLPQEKPMNISSIDVVEQLIQQRAEAKANKDWAKADEIRAQVTEMGFKLIDQKDGPTTYEPL